MSDEREALDDGVNGEFWKLFGVHVAREWGPAGIRYQQAVHAAAQSQTAVVDLQKVLYAQEEITKLMCWPVERLKLLQADAKRSKEPDPSRRGGL